MTLVDVVPWSMEATRRLDLDDEEDEAPMMKLAKNSFT